jgi:hypothetical protein
MCVRVYVWRGDPWIPGTQTSDCARTCRNAYVYFTGREKCRSASPWPATGAMKYSIFDDDCSATAKTEQALSGQHTQQEPAVARNSWRDLLEIVDTYLARRGVDG